MAGGAAPPPPAAVPLRKRRLVLALRFRRSARHTGLIPGGDAKIRGLAPSLRAGRTRIDATTLTPNTVTTPGATTISLRHPTLPRLPTLIRPQLYKQRPPSPSRLHIAYHHRHQPPIRNPAAHDHPDHKRCSRNHILLRHNNKPIASQLPSLRRPKCLLPLAMPLCRQGGGGGVAVNH